MVLKEILETCPVICEIDATIRDKRGYRLEEYKIGPLVEEDREYFWIPNEHTGKLEPRWKCIKKPINYKDPDRRAQEADGRKRPNSGADELGTGGMTMTYLQTVIYGVCIVAISFLIHSIGGKR